MTITVVNDNIRTQLACGHRLYSQTQAAQHTHAHNITNTKVRRDTRDILGWLGDTLFLVSWVKLHHKLSDDIVNITDTSTNLSTFL